MRECVEKQALKSQLKLEADCGHVSTIQDVFDIIDFIPAADVRPVVRGRWEWHGPCRDSNGKFWATCSACRERQRLGDFQRFCPNCGADMRPENEEMKNEDA